MRARTTLPYTPKKGNQKCPKFWTETNHPHSSAYIQIHPRGDRGLDTWIDFPKLPKISQDTPPNLKAMELFRCQPHRIATAASLANAAPGHGNKCEDAKMTEWELYLYSYLLIGCEMAWNTNRYRYLTSLSPNFVMPFLSLSFTLSLPCCADAHRRQAFVVSGLFPIELLHSAEWCCCSVVFDDDCSDSLIACGLWCCEL